MHLLIATCIFALLWKRLLLAARGRPIEKLENQVTYLSQWIISPTPVKTLQELVLQHLNHFQITRTKSPICSRVSLSKLWTGAHS